MHAHVLLLLTVAADAAYVVKKVFISNNCSADTFDKVYVVPTSRTVCHNDCRVGTACHRSGGHKYRDIFGDMESVSEVSASLSGPPQLDLEGGSISCSGGRFSFTPAAGENCECADTGVISGCDRDPVAFDTPDCIDVSTRYVNRLGVLSHKYECIEQDLNGEAEYSDGVKWSSGWVYADGSEDTGKSLPETCAVCSEHNSVVRYDLASQRDGEKIEFNEECFGRPETTTGASISDAMFIKRNGIYGVSEYPTSTTTHDAFSASDICCAMGADPRDFFTFSGFASDCYKCKPGFPNCKEDYMLEGGTAGSDGTTTGGTTTGSGTTGSGTTGDSTNIPTNGAEETPCFARDASACRVLDTHADADAAFSACFSDGAASLAERVPMPDLVAGDVVLSATDEGAQVKLTRVLVNQHRLQGLARSTVVRISHSRGTLGLTPDHVLLVDGALIPARYVEVGSRLSGGAVVTAVHLETSGVVNPLTTDGRILAAGPTGEPVFATCFPEWISELMTTSTLYPLPHSLTGAVVHFFPASVQEYYDAHLESAFSAVTPVLKRLEAAVPAPVSLGIILAFDLMLVSSFALWASFSLEGIAAIVIITATATRVAACAKKPCA